MSNDKDVQKELKRKQTVKTVLVVLVIGEIVQLIAAISYGLRCDWFRFGISLAGAVIAVILIATVLIISKIDTQFKKIEDLMRQRDNKIDRL